MRLINRLASGFRAKSVPASRDDSSGLDQPWLAPYIPIATKADIVACFRLLLGRNPQAQEWLGHTMHAGEPLAEVVASYLKSLEFSRRNLNHEIAGEIVLSELPGFKIFSNRNDGAVGKYVRQGSYEADVTAVFHDLLKPGMAVLDIGANIGYFTMLSASAVGNSGHVIAVEPNQENVKLLEASRRLNEFSHVTVLPIAAGAQSGCLALHTSHSTGTTSALPAQAAALFATRIVPCLALDDLMPARLRIDLIKIDVDGAEYLAMRGCEALVQRDRPAIISEFAPSLMPGTSGVNGEQYLHWFAAQDYGVSIIQPDGTLDPVGQEWHKVMETHRQRGTDHIDLLAKPIMR